MNTSRLRRECAGWCIVFITSALLSGCTPFLGRTIEGRGDPAVPSGLRTSDRRPGVETPGYCQPSLRDDERKTSLASGAPPIPSVPSVPLAASPNALVPSCPEGTNENSPAFQRRVRQQQKSPEGTTEHREQQTRIATQEVSEDQALIALLLLVAIAIFVPGSVPIVGRIFALLVNRIPALAGFSGLVSVEAFDAIVKVIERSKENVRMANEPGSLLAPRSNSAWIDELHQHLSRELDASHKRLVHARKRTFVQ